MKRLLLSAMILALPLPAMAQAAASEFSPIQQYLYGETGYAPGSAAPVAAPADQDDPYDTAYVPEDSAYLSPEEVPQDHLNHGVAGMNF